MNLQLAVSLIEKNSDAFTQGPAKIFVQHACLGPLNFFVESNKQTYSRLLTGPTALMPTGTMFRPHRSNRFMN